MEHREGRYYCLVATGGREIIPTMPQLAAMGTFIKAYGVTIVFTGNHAHGVDAAIREWCVLRGTPYAGFDAPWEALGCGAGPRRNGWMCDVAARLMGCVVAWPGGAGTASCVGHARALQLPIYWVRNGAIVEDRIH